MAVFDHRAFEMRFAEAMDRLDDSRAAQMLQPGFVTDWPQSGERVRGFENIWATIGKYSRTNVASQPANDAATLNTQPIDAVHLVSPTFTLVAMEGAGSAGTFTIRVSYPERTTWWVVTIYRLRDEPSTASSGRCSGTYGGPQTAATSVRGLSCGGSAAGCFAHRW